MIWIFIICLILFIILLEKKLSKISLKNLSVCNSINVSLAEPDESITLTSKVYNKGFFPIMYVKLTQYLPLISHMTEEKGKGFIIKAEKEAFFVQCVMYLMPHMRRTFQYHFSLPNRGIYELGDFSISAGDYLGINDSSASGKSPVRIVIMPHRSQNREVLKTIGGFIGDISVRRFILEDPVMTVGFNEYTGREPFKSISWLRSARTGKLHVKQYDHTVDMTVSVILNTENGSESRLEVCYILTRTVCEELEKKHIPYEFYSNGDISGPLGMLSHVCEGLGRQHLNTILYGLGCARHECIRSFETLIKQCIQHQKPNQGYIIISPTMSTEQIKIVENLKRTVTDNVCVLIGEHEEN